MELQKWQKYGVRKILPMSIVKGTKPVKAALMGYNVDFTDDKVIEKMMLDGKIG